MMKILFYLGAVICVFSTIISFILIRKQQNKELDKEMSQTTVNHPVIANSMLIAYLLFPVLVILGAMIWLYFTK
jgi:NADH:ubiquinone oxidoreductase subunit 6 (subunit J)